MKEAGIVKGSLALGSRECQNAQWGLAGLNRAAARADHLAYMRTIGFRSNILFAIAAAIGVIAALGRPWYGRAADPTDARMEDLFNGIGRAATERGGTSGWAALATADKLLAGLALGTVVLLVLTLAPALQRHVQALARWTALATLGVVLVKLVDEPGSNAVSEPRHGILIALGAALVLVASTNTVATAPQRRRAPVRPYVPPPPPVYEPDSSYGPPQF